ncbi:MAG: hypothetical protein ACI9KE_003870 [Polyangiales bacterium]
MTPEQLDALTVEARRIHERFSIEFVEDFGFCPWAKKARVEGRTATRVLPFGEGDATAPILSAMKELGEDESYEVTFILFPILEIERKAFERLTATLREEYAELYDGSPPMALAAFHPSAPFNDSSAARALPFVRRSPDPTIQMVRRSVLDSVRSTSDSGTGFLDLEKIDMASILSAPPAKPPLHKRVAETNAETLRSEGKERLEAVLADICRDRDDSYSRLMKP